MVDAEEVIVTLKALIRSAGNFGATLNQVRSPSLILAG